MKQLYSDLWQTKIERPFAGLQTHAYFLQTPAANILIYNTGHVDEIDAFADMGGIQYQLLSHRDEAGNSLSIIKQKFNSILCCHKLEVPAISSKCKPDVTFSEDKIFLAGVTVLHTPGHTVGSVSFLYDTPSGVRYLFTGDTLFQTHGEWRTMVFSTDDGSTDTLRNSLLIYRDLSPDIVFWSGSGGGDQSYEEVTGSMWRLVIDSAINQLAAI